MIWFPDCTKLPWNYTKHSEPDTSQKIAPTIHAAKKKKLSIAAEDPLLNLVPDAAAVFHPPVVKLRQNDLHRTSIPEWKTAHRARSFSLFVRPVSYLRDFSGYSCLVTVGFLPSVVTTLTSISVGSSETVPFVFPIVLPRGFSRSFSACVFFLLIS